MTYTGIHILKIDDKGRISVPAAFRNGEEGEFRLIEHPNAPVLIGHVESDFDGQISSLSTIFSRTLSYKKEGRICLGADLKSYIGLSADSKEVAVIGMGNHFQIWSLENWKKVEPEYKARLVDALMKQSVWVPPTSDKNS